LHVCIYLNYS